MRNKLFLQNDYLGFLPAVLATGVVFYSFVFIADSQAKSSFTADELFDKSVADLRATMEKARTSNETFQENNRLLQKEVDSLNQELTDASSKKDDIQNQASSSSSVVTLSEQEKALYEARGKNLSSRLSRFKDDQSYLKKKIKYFQEDNLDASKQIASLEEEISQLQLKTSEEKSQVAVIEDSDGPKDIALEMADSAKRISALEKKMAVQKKILQEKTSVKEPLEEIYSRLSAQFSQAEEQLLRLKAEKKLMPQEVDAASRDFSLREDTLRQEIADLKDYRDRLKESLADLQKAAAVVRTAKKKDASGILKELQQQQALLKKKMGLLEKVNLGHPSAKEQNTQLIERKERLAAVKNDLQLKILSAKKESEPANLLSSTDEVKNPAQLKNKIKESTARLGDLRKKINASQATLAMVQKNQELISQAETLEKKMQVLRNTPAVSLQEDTVIETTETKALKSQIEQLEARRVILAESLGTIHSKYQLSDISSKNSLAKEAQLKEYLATLTLENKALQEKLLTLQMRQDKNPR